MFKLAGSTFYIMHTSVNKYLSMYQYMYIYVLIIYTCATLLIYYAHYNIEQNFKGGQQFYLGATQG